MQPESNYYDSSGLRLHYVTWGNPTSPPLLLIHGGQDHCRNWDWVARALSDRFYIIAPDLRGHGDSDWAAGNAYSMADFVYDIAELVEQRALEKLSLIGHSLGGAIALKYLGSFRDKVTKAVIIEGLIPASTIKQGSEDAAESMQKWFWKKRRIVARPLRTYPSQDAVIGRMQEANGHLSAQQARHLAINGSRANRDGSYSWKFDPLVRVSQPFDMTPEQSCQLWQQVRCPLLLVRGEDSWAGDPVEDRRISYFRDARLVNLPDAGHWPHHDQLERFLEQVEGFL